MTTPAPPSLPDTPCLACGYNLRGLAHETHCPECGTTITEATARYTLANLPARWFSQVQTGILVLVITQIVSYLTGLIIFQYFLQPPSLTSSPLAALTNYLSLFKHPDTPDAPFQILAAIYVLFSIMRWFGILLVAAPNSAHPSVEKRLRFAAYLALAIEVFEFVYYIEFYTLWFPHSFFNSARGWIFSLAHTWLAWELCTHFRIIALKAGKPFLSGTFTALRWIFVVAFATTYLPKIVISRYAEISGYTLYYYALRIAIISAIILALLLYHRLTQLRRLALTQE